MCASYWWGDTNKKYRLHWARWEKLCRPKDKDGMGFRNLKALNKALLAKVPANSSFVWRSIAWSRDIIDAGHIWKVGDGMNIRMKEDV
ncbi:uncharacterized mitochondrial protein AtMg00310-like [Salvia miltiorrhiza]|uniref:uncharacterized mitochondrial protein AtMg00310-like n=1 Tax=Salvia miltiorrhiza TaxID=226208 RepID=UPI0025AC03E0|nr:uncharacterized mitochondrial protein AtMg00310-like [Salvia miltiorrhiza]